MGGGRSHNDCDKFPGGEKSESLEELLREAGEEFEFLKTTISYENLQVRRQSWFWKTGSPPVWPRKRKVSLMVVVMRTTLVVRLEFVFSFYVVCILVVTHRFY